MVKNPPTNAGDARDASLMPGLGRSPGGGHGNPPQCSCWRIPWTEESGELVSRVAKTRLSVPGGTTLMSNKAGDGFQTSDVAAVGDRFDRHTNSK